MFFRQLQYLTALAQEEHFGRAAARCNVSQPSLSSAIKQLELTLGVPIVLRGRRFLGFTSEGQKIIEWAERVISQRDAMLVELSGMRENFEGRLRLGAMPNSSPVQPLFSQLLAQKHPGVEVDIKFLGIELPAAAQPVIDYMERIFRRESFIASLTQVEAEMRPGYARTGY